MLLYVINDMYLSREQPSKLTTYGTRLIKSAFSYLQDTLGLLQQNESFLIVLSLNEVVGCISQLCKDNRYLVLIDFYFFVIHLVEGVAFLGCGLIAARFVIILLVGSVRARAATTTLLCRQQVSLRTSLTF